MTPRPRRRGSNLIEFALLMPVFWLIIAGMIDMGWLFYHQAMLDTATNIGCRAGALVDPGDGESRIAEVRQTAEKAMVKELGKTPGTTCVADEEKCTLSVSAFGDPPGRSLYCSVTRDFTPLLGIGATSTQLDSGIVVRMEWQRWP